MLKSWDLQGEWVHTFLLIVTNLISDPLTTKQNNLLRLSQPCTANILLGSNSIEKFWGGYNLAVMGVTIEKGLHWVQRQPIG